MRSVRHRARRRGILAAFVPAAALAAAPRTARAALDELPDKPFAEHRLALQLSDRDRAKHLLAISVANNMLKAFEPDKIAVEVVAFGPGIDLLRAESPDRQAVDSLVSQGVLFDVCMNTVATVEHETGQAVALNPHARHVDAGVAQLLLLAEAGFTVIRP